MIGFPSKAIEDDVSLRFFSVVLSRREAVLLRGGPRRKGLGGVNTYTCSSFPCLELPFVILVVQKSDDYCCACGSTASTRGSTAGCHGSTALLEW